MHSEELDSDGDEPRAAPAHRDGIQLDSTLEEARRSVAKVAGRLRHDAFEAFPWCGKVDAAA